MSKMKYFRLFNFLTLVLVGINLSATQSVKSQSTYTAISSTASEIKEDIKSESLFPKDTVIRFIQNYSKDSLIHLIEKRIYKAEDFIQTYLYLLDDELVPIELTMVADHFGLDIKVPAENMPTKSPYFLLYHLYGKGYGPDTLKQAKTVDSIAAKNADMTDMFMQFIDNKYAQISYVSFCNKVKLQNARIFNTFYDNAKLLQINEKLHIYWLFAELNRNNCKTTLSEEYQSKLFEELYKENNLQKNYLTAYQHVINDTIQQDTSSAETSLLYSLVEYNRTHNSNKFLAYAVYGNDINLNQYSSELMYLLDAQLDNGGWAVAKQFNEINKDIQSTIYGLWALCEFRSKLIKDYK